MFKISQSETYSWPVRVQIPTDEGKFHTHSFTAYFRRVPQSRFEELLANDARDRDIAAVVMAGWGDDVVDVDDNPVAFSDAALAQFLDFPGVAAAVVIAYAESLQGAKRKN